jgi:hypothetical protein
MLHLNFSMFKILILLIVICRAGSAEEDKNLWIGVSDQCVRPFGLRRPVLCFDEAKFTVGQKYNLGPLLTTTTTTTTTCKLILVCILIGCYSA